MEPMCKDGAPYETRHYFLACYFIKIILYSFNKSLCTWANVNRFLFAHLLIEHLLCARQVIITNMAGRILPLWSLLPYKHICLYACRVTGTALTRQYHAHDMLNSTITCESRYLWGLFLPCFTRSPKKGQSQNDRIVLHSGVARTSLRICKGESSDS